MQETSEKEKKRSNRQCYDPIKEDFLTYGALKGRKSRNKEIYKNINPSDCIIKNHGKIKQKMSLKSHIKEIK